ncbi:MAG TPA: aspartate/glutamate racemase family protein, partial [Burkholderiales bacterium]|nr:aspartate/glutamate racemase family protein [Burkholderiales bacterium]
MKLWYQSLARQAESIPYGVDLKKLIASIADPDTTVHVQGLSEAAGIGAHYRFLEYHDMKEVIYNAIRAEKEGYDAFLIGNITDAGIREAREMVNIPVLGLSETSLHMACIMGTSFGLVAISGEWIRRLLENVERYGFERRLVGIEPMDTSPLRMREAFGDRERSAAVVAGFTAAAKRLLKKGAEVIIPAGGEIVVFLAQAGIFELDRAPVLNGIFELIKMAEMAVRLRALTGRFT